MLRVCVECGNRLTGRKDKKFCNYHCRSSYHNRANASMRYLTSAIHLVIKRNRDILETSMKNGSMVIHPKELKTQGFRFDFLSHEIDGRHGNKIRCCYDLAYIRLSENKILIVRCIPTKIKSSSTLSFQVLDNNLCEA